MHFSWLSAGTASAVGHRLLHAVWELITHNTNADAMIRPADQSAQE